MGNGIKLKIFEARKYFISVNSFIWKAKGFTLLVFAMTVYVSWINWRFNRGVSHYRILPVSRDIGWPVQQLDYFRYIKQHILTVDLNL